MVRVIGYETIGCRFKSFLTLKIKEKKWNKKMVSNGFEPLVDRKIHFVFQERHFKPLSQLTYKKIVKNEEVLGKKEKVRKRNQKIPL